MLPGLAPDERGNRVRVIAFATAWIGSSLVSPAVAIADVGIPPGYITSPDSVVVVLVTTAVVAAVTIPSYLLLRKIARSTAAPQARSDGESQLPVDVSS